jgi:ABC-type sulfate/molybdate transport systems ATPase subunit
VSAVLELDHVSVARAKRTVVHEITMSVEPGEVVALLGPNGAGKSTLLEAVGGVIPAGGTITRHGRVATVLQAPGLARRSVVANVDLAQSWWGVPRGERRARSLAALTELHADHLARRHSVALSGGEQRRVHLARGLAVRPDLLLLDEPFAGLDAESHASLVEDSATALRQSSSATVVVTHERADAWALADRVVVLLDGRVAADGPPPRLLAEPPSAAVARFLGYDGALRSGDELTLTRAPHVVVDPDGDLAATVLRVVRQEDGARVQLGLEAGTLWARVADEGPAVGEQVRARVVGGVRFREPG